MKKSSIKIIRLTVFVFFLFFVESVSACQCGESQTPYERYRGAAAVFVGTAISSRVVESHDGPFGKKKYFRFKVQENFKGARVLEIDISSGVIDSMCYVDFPMAIKLLVYARKERDGLASEFGCGSTNHFISGSDDIFYIRRLKKNLPEPRVYGSVMYEHDSETKGGNRFAEGIKIIVEGNGRRFETLTDKNGLYNFNDIPDGEYNVKPELSPRFKSYGHDDYNILIGSNLKHKTMAVRSASFIEFYIGLNSVPLKK